MGDYPPRHPSKNSGFDRGEAEQHSEGKIARTLERETAKLPSDVWLWAAVGSMTAAAALQASRRYHSALFVGQWAAPLLLIGVYNKLVKQHGSDRAHV